MMLFGEPEKPKNKKRYEFYILKSQLTDMQWLSDHNGLTIPAMIRIAIDEYISLEREKIAAKKREESNVSISPSKSKTELPQDY